MAPRCMAPLFILSAIALLITDWHQNKRLPRPDKTLLTILGGVIGYGLISYFWSINQPDTLTKVGQMIGTFGMVPFVAPILARLETKDFYRLGQLWLVGLGLGTAIYLSEWWNGFELYDLTHPGNNDPVDSKQNKAIVLLSLWLVMAAPYLFVTAQKNMRLIFLGLMALIGYGSSVSHSATAELLFLALPILALIVWKLPARFTMTLALIGTVGLTTLMPFIAVGIYNHTNWQHTETINRSLKSRVEIWNQASSRAFEKPIFGWGLDASPNLPNRGETSVLFDFPMDIHHLHPHNGPIQIWFELGAIGVAAFCALFVTLYRRMKTLPEAAQKYATFGASGIFLYTLSIWGIWQSWFMASLCFAGLMVYAGAKFLQNKTAA
ncbi:MAG TPA: O-antigen ligase family protein [Alphaproteobacteria bacterium]